MADRIIGFDPDRPGTGLPAVVEQRLEAHLGGTGTAPHIGENGNWWVGDEDLGVLAQQVVMSTDPDHPLLDGQVLLILPVSTFFTDFTEYTLDEPPHDWSLRWVSGDPLFTVTSDPLASGGVSLWDGPSGGQGNRALSWDPIGQVTDAEIVFKWRASDIAAPIRAISRGSGGIRTGIHAGAQNAGRISVQTARSSNTSTDIVFEDRTMQSDTWYVTRFRAEGEQVYLRQWLASDPEPTGWDLAGTEDVVTGAGWVGLRTFSAVQDRYVDWFGVGIDGATAPTGPMEV